MITIRSFLPKKKKKIIAKLDRPPLLPDFALCDLWPFRKMKTAIKGRGIYVYDIQKHVTKKL